MGQLGFKSKDGIIWHASTKRLRIVVLKTSSRIPGSIFLALVFEARFKPEAMSALSAWPMEWSIVGFHLLQNKQKGGSNAKQWTQTGRAKLDFPGTIRRHGSSAWWQSHFKHLRPRWALATEVQTGAHESLHSHIKATFWMIPLANTSWFIAKSSTRRAIEFTRQKELATKVRNWARCNGSGTGSEGTVARIVNA